MTKVSLRDNMLNWFNFDLFSVIASKRVPNLINKLITSYSKCVSSRHSVSLRDNMLNWFNFDLFSVIASKRVPNLINKLITSYSKCVSSRHSVDQMKKLPKFDVSFQPPCFTLYSLIVFPFENFLTDNLKTYGLIYF